MTTVRTRPAATRDGDGREEPAFGHLDTRWLLDESVQAQASRGALRHAGRYAVVLVVATVVLELAGGLTGRELPRGLDALAGESVVGVVIYFCCRPLVRRCGGWGDALGLDTPLLRDVAVAARWFIAQNVARWGIVIVAVAAPALRHGHQLTNMHGLGRLSVVQADLLGVSAVVVAPVVEEVAFRGLWLRALMRRWRFWPAAVVSSVVFALLHAHEASTLLALPVLLASMTAFGVLQCMLVRRTGRLAPAILVHAIGNLIAIAVVLAATK